MVAERGKQTVASRAAQLPGWVYSVLPLLVVWEVVGRTGRYRSIPSLTEIGIAANELARNSGVWADALSSLESLVYGFGSAVVMGTVVGFLMGTSRFWEVTLGTYVNMFMGAPISALVPVIVLLFGLDQISIVVIVFLFSFFFMAVNVYTGVKEVDPDLVEMAHSFGASRRTMLLRVIMPAALPFALTGFRIAIGRAVNGAVLGEMLIAIVGLGGRLMFFGSAFQVDRLFALVAFIVLFAYVLMGITLRLERRVAAWRTV